MTVAELRKALERLPDEMLVGVEDSDDETVKVRWAGVLGDNLEDGTGTGQFYFFISAMGGVPLFDR